MSKLMHLVAPAFGLCLLGGGGLFAQSSSSNPLSTSTKGVFTMIKGNVMKAAEEMPESNYSFKPVDSVRSYGEVVAHIADGQYEFCSAAMGDKGEDHPQVEKTAKTKAEITEGLKTAFAYCDKAYTQMTDAKAAEMASFFGRQMPKLTILSLNTAHTDEHYGNLVTYLRIKGMVPPSSKQ